MSRLKILPTVTSAERRDDRRASDRFSIEREVRYRVIGKRQNHGESEEGAGTTINISSNGVLFATDHVLIPATRLELSIDWPAELDNRCRLKLIVHGRVVRVERGRVAAEIQQYEFRTAGRIRPEEEQRYLAG